MDLEHWIKRRAYALSARPQMWAATKETYVNAFAMLLELTSLPDKVSRDLIMKLYKPITYGSGIKGAGDDVTDEFAKEVSDIFYGLCPHLKTGPEIEDD